MFHVNSLMSSPCAADKLVEIRDKIANKTKPLGALGQLETLAEQLAMIQSAHLTQPCKQLEIVKPTALVFAGDHGIAQHNVSIAPSDVTRQMVLNFLQGGAAINCFCRSNEIELQVVDCGIQTPLTKEEISGAQGFIESRLGAGTGDISQRAAMTEQQVHEGLQAGKNLVASVIKLGTNVVILGEMGIANTSSASAIFMALTGMSAKQCVGQGTGITQTQLAEKQALIDVAVQRASSEVGQFEPMNIIAQLGGFEIVHMVGAMLGAAEAGITVLVDGFIVSSAALLAARMQPNVTDYFVFAHQSDEQAHKVMLETLNANPLLSLGLRLGEGTGAALALPLLSAAASFYNDMASFESAGVTV